MPLSPARGAMLRAEEIVNELTEPLAHPDLTDPAALAAAPGWTLHDLRHSALTHDAENAAGTGTLLAYSGYASVAGLARYTRVSPDALTRRQARRDLTAEADRAGLLMSRPGSRSGIRAARWAMFSSRS